MSNLKNYIHSIFKILDLEKKLRSGTISPAVFKKEVKKIYHFSENEQFLHSVLVSTLHYPLKTSLYILWIPLSLVIISSLQIENTIRIAVALFIFYSIIRLLLGFYESWMFYTTRDRTFTFNVGIWSTALGTLPYRSNWFTGPLIASLMDIALYLPFLYLTDLNINILSISLNMISTLALMQTIIGTFARMGLNLLAVLELPLLNNIEFRISMREKIYNFAGVFWKKYKMLAVNYRQLITYIGDDFEGEKWDSAMKKAENMQTDFYLLKKVLLKTRYEYALINSVSMELKEAK